MRTWLTRRVVVVLAVVAMLALGGSVVLGAIPSGGGTIYACYAKTTGALRVVNYPTVKCASSEKMLALASATMVTTKHVDGSLVVLSPGGFQFIARFEVRTTPEGVVQFGYMELYGINKEVGGKIIQFTISHVDYYKTASGAQGARFSDSQECRMTPWEPCFPSGYYMTDGSGVGEPDTFLGNWVIQSGDISIYTTGG